MGQNIDELILREKNKYKTLSYGDIYKGVYMKEELIEFENTKLFNDQFSIYMPKEFKDMSDEHADLKYPMRNRPQIIKTNANTDVNFCFNLIPQELEQGNLKKFTEQMKKVIKTVQTATVFYQVLYIDKAGICRENYIQSDEEVEGRLETSFFDYKSPAIDEPLYYFMMFAPYKKQVFHASFNCCLKDSDCWKSVFMQVIDSLRVCKGE